MKTIKTFEAFLFECGKGNQKKEKCPECGKKIKNCKCGKKMKNCKCGRKCECEEGKCECEKK
jgi:hypothetical protein